MSYRERAKSLLEEIDYARPRTQEALEHFRSSIQEEFDLIIDYGVDVDEQGLPYESFLLLSQNKVDLWIYVPMNNNSLRYDIDMLPVTEEIALAFLTMKIGILEIERQRYGG